MGAVGLHEDPFQLKAGMSHVITSRPHTPKSRNIKIVDFESEGNLARGRWQGCGPSLLAAEPKSYPKQKNIWIWTRPLWSDTSIPIPPQKHSVSKQIIDSYDAYQYITNTHHLFYSVLLGLNWLMAKNLCKGWCLYTNKTEVEWKQPE